jgi:transaldolase/glucose-6-phosphate isomerase
VDIEPETEIANYGTDRIFVYFRNTGSHDPLVERLVKTRNTPVLVFQVNDPYELGGIFYQWEIAVTVACEILRVNPFDQPDVQLAKTLAFKKLEDYQKKGSFEEKDLIWEGKEGKVFGKGIPKISSTKSLAVVIDIFLKQVKKGDYVAINAFLPRNPGTLADLQEFRKSVLLKTDKATTLGFGPRYLHSTGQLHKGGPNSGVFVLLSHDSVQDLLIPNQKYSFAVLEKGQALGDFESLQSRKRRVIRIHTNKKLGSLLKKGTKR